MDSRVYIIGRDEVPGRMRLAAGEKLRVTLVVPEGVSCSLAVEIDFDGPGAELDLAGAYTCSGDQKVELDVNLHHDAGGCVSRQLFKGIVSGNARAAFHGLVYVAPDAQKTKALQENHSILLSESARVESQPQLEIYADDVECSHGATVGSLDPEQQFYMRSRGIPEDEARRLQTEAFLAPVLNRLP